jgi:hypothetical protein
MKGRSRSPNDDRWSLALVPIVDKEVYLMGRRIFLKSNEVKSLESEVFLSVFSNDGNTRDKTHGIPISLTSIT